MRKSAEEHRNYEVGNENMENYSVFNGIKIQANDNAVLCELLNTATE